MMRELMSFEHAPDQQPLPPVLLRGMGNSTAFEVVREVAGDLGVVLWQSLRNVRLWACSPEEKHHPLFSEEAPGKRHEQLSRLAEIPELYGPLAIIAELLGNPLGVDRARLTDACFNIAGWAEAHQAPGTAQEFMQAGALASPELARPAYLFAKTVRKHADYPLAESWFWRAIHLARRRQDWKVYALAWSGLGNLHVLRGNYPAAKRAHLRVYRAAKRHGLPEIQGDALHDLFGIAIETEGVDAERLALSALRAYGWRSSKLPALAHDVAYLWVVRGEFSRALPVAEALVAHFASPAERLQALGDVARAAGGAGNPEKFLSAFAEMGQLKLDPESELAHARAFLDAAHGAASLGQAELARGIARFVLKVARKRREGKIIFAAESLLSSIPKSQSTRTAEGNPGAHIGDVLADQLVDALSRQQALSCPSR